MQNRQKRPLKLPKGARLIEDGASIVLGLAHAADQEPRYVAFEYWQRGLPEIVPARWRPDEAWAYVGDRWVAVDPTDAGVNGRLLARAAYEQLFGPLPPLPSNAFSA
jgi:hypothetical protein